MINQHTTDAIKHYRHCIGRIREVVAYSARRTKLRQHTRKTFSPITGAKTLAIESNAMNY